MQSDKALDYSFAMPRIRRSEQLKREAGQRLKAARLALGLQQKEIYEAIGVMDNTYSQWETGKALIDIVAAIAIEDKFGITLGWIYKGQAQDLPSSIRGAVHSSSADTKPSRAAS